jgi:hypothetical protein
MSAASLIGSMLLASCNRAAPAEPPEPSMWYRFKFEATYGGRPVQFDQFVHCGRVRVPGGPLGATPALTTRGMHPETIGAPLADGSHLVLRLPDLCLRHRRYEINGPYLRGGQRLPGWESRGPFSVLPLVIWNDKRPNTTRAESYVSPLYYDQPEARIKSPRGSVEFMPLGYEPPNADAVLAQKNEPLFDSGPKINPATGKPWAMGERPYLSAQVVVPISNMNQYVAELEALKARYPADTKHIEHPRMTANYQRPGPRFTSYDWIGHPGYAWKAEHRNYFPAGYVEDCIRDLQEGFPGMSDLPPDTYDHHFYEDRESVERAQEGTAERRAKGSFGYTRAEQIEWEFHRRKNCYLHLGQLRSISVDKGRFEATELPGAIVYRPWTAKIVGTATDRPDALRSRGTFSADGYPVLWLNGGLVPYRGQSSIIEDRQTGKWYAVEHLINIATSRFE